MVQTGNDIFKYLKISLDIMSEQINIRMSQDFLKRAETYAQKKGYLSVQEFFREAVREKLFSDTDVRPEYRTRLASEDATTFLSPEETAQLDKQMK